MYPHVNIDDSKTCTSIKMELNAKSDQNRTDGQGRGIKMYNGIFIYLKKFKNKGILLSLSVDYQRIHLTNIWGTKTFAYFKHL